MNPTPDPQVLAPALATLLQALRGQALELPFLVTLAPGVSAASLPFAVETEVALIRLASGRMSPAQALALAQRGDIERIEFDGEAQALRDLLDQSR